VRRRRIRFDAGTITWIVLAGIGLYFAIRTWNWWQDRPPWVDPIVHYILHTGLKETLRLAAISVVSSALVGIVLGTLLTIRFLPTRALIRLYIEIWRGLPIVVTIFLIYFALPSATNVRLSPFTAGAIGLTLWGSAQVAEATRGAVQSIPREQHEAAAALGFGWVGRHAFVVLPQAFRRLLPPMVSLLVNVIQNTTIVALIGVAEVLETGNRSVERLTFTTADPHAFEIFAFVMAIFFVISFPLTRLASFLERRLV
jgi:polar amino acid transport system permease protein